MRTACFIAIIGLATQHVGATGVIGGVYPQPGALYGNAQSIAAPSGQFSPPPVPMTGPTPPMTTGALPPMTTGTIPPMTTGRVDGQGYRSGTGVPGVIYGPPSIPYIPPSIGSDQVIQTPQGNGLGR